MSTAYVDTSCLVAILFDEPEGPESAAWLASHERLVSSNLLEAELTAALRREKVDAEPDLLGGFTWVLPDRPLSPEIRRVLAQGYVRGADLWHLATALYLAEVPHELPFLTLDRRQRDVASALGFPTP